MSTINLTSIREKSNGFSVGHSIAFPVLSLTGKSVKLKLKSDDMFFSFHTNKAAVINILNHGSYPAKEAVLGLQSASPKVFSVVQKYPNPFNPTTQLRYTLRTSTHVSLKIHDMLGRELATLVNGYQEAGYKFVQFDAGNLPSGVYFYRVQAGRFVDVKKMLLMR